MCTEVREMKNIMAIFAIILLFGLCGCDTELGHSGEDHDHDGDGIQDHTAEDHELEEDMYGHEEDDYSLER